MGTVHRNFEWKSLERKLQMPRDNGGLHSTIRHTLWCSRLIGLLPLSGLWSTTSDKLKFTFRSPYTIIYVISVFGQCLMSAMSFFWLLNNGISLNNITNTIFYSSNLTSLIILANIGRSWPLVIRNVEAVEVILPPFRRNVASMCNITMVFILVAASVEHFLSVFYGLAVAYSCNGNDVAEAFFQYNMPWIFDYTSYALWKGILGEIFSIQSTFIWSFNDLLIVVISIYLTEHIIIHNAMLKRAIKQDYFSAVDFRLQHLNIVRLVKIVNGQIGIYILTSFGSNLFWICTQLFFSLNKNRSGHVKHCNIYSSLTHSSHEIEHTIYFTFSFSFIVLRTLMVLLLAAKIHNNSLVPLVHLYGLPSEKFDVEVERFIAQINNIKVALSGLDFFYVTRTMILTLLGTIVTYELVLLQFNN